MEAIKVEANAPKVEVQGVPGAYETTAQQPQDAPNPSQNGLDEFLTFDNAKQNGIKQELEEEIIETGHVETVESTTEEENVDVVFEVNGQKINACMSASMAQMLKESEEMRLQVIDKIMAEAGNNPDQPITVTTGEATSRDTSATESADSPTIKREAVKTEPGTNSTSNVSPRLNGKFTLGKRPYSATVAPEKKNLMANKVVTRGSVGIVKPKLEQKFMPAATLRPATTTPKKLAGPFIGKHFFWDHKAIVALIECYRSVNERLTAMGAIKNVDVWSIVGKRMRARGFQVSDIECQGKFSTLTVSHGNSFKVKKKDPPGKSLLWEYKPSESTPDQARLLKTTSNKRQIPVITVEDESPGVSDGEGLEDDEESSDPTTKKAKLDGDATNTTQAIDKLRRTYLRVETEKLKELKASRALQQEQCKLRRETNELLSTIASLLGQKKE